MSKLRMSNYPDPFFIIKGWSLAIIAIVSSLAILLGENQLVSPAVHSLVPIPNYIATIILLFVLLKEGKPLRPYTPLMICVILYWLLITFHLYGNIGIELHILALTILLLFCLLGEKVWLFSYLIYKKFLILSSFLGIISYISYIFSLGLPYQIVPYYFFAEKGWVYINFYFSHLVFDTESLRLCGVFNEPGYFGTILALCLVVENFNLKKLGNLLMFIAGCLTLSLAYYILIIIFVLYRLAKQPKYFFQTIFITFVLIFLLYRWSDTNEIVAALLNRFSFEDGHFVGNTHTSDDVDKLVRKMFLSGNFLFGYGVGYLNEMNTGTLSYKNYILEHGIIGALMIWGSLFLSVLRYLKSSTFIFIFLFFISIYQRPSIITVNYFLVLFGGIQCIKFKDSKDDKSRRSLSC